MKVFGIINWGSSMVNAVEAETLEAAQKDLDARGFAGMIVEIHIHGRGDSARISQVPPRRETHFERAAKIAREGREGSLITDLAKKR